MTKVRLTELSDQNLDLFYQLDQVFFPFPWSKNLWNELIGSSQYGLFGLLDNGRYVGFSLWKLISSEKLAHLLKIVVIPEFRQCGEGEKILQKSIKHLSKRYEKFYLEVETDNSPAYRCYEKIGFVRKHCVRSFYSTGSDTFSLIAENYLKGEHK